MLEDGTRTFYGKGTNQDSCATGAKILDSVGIHFLVRLEHPAINFVLQVGKDMENRPPRDQGVIVRKQPPVGGSKGREDYEVTINHLYIHIYIYIYIYSVCVCLSVCMCDLNHTFWC